MLNKTGARRRNSLRNFARERGGSVTTIFAIAMVPVIIAAGVGVDMSRAIQNRQNLQDALDSTALALAHLPPTTTQATLNTKANAWLNANLNSSSMGAITLTTTLTTGEVVLDASSYVPTTLTSIAGVQQIPISARSKVNWGLGHVEVALVLDNTGSMAGTKLSNLKSAATSLVDTLASSTDTSDPNALKIGLVPFSMTVKIGSTYQSSTWMAGTAPTQYFPNAAPYADLFNADVGNVNRFTLLHNMGVTWAGCVESRPAPYDVQDTAPVAGTPATLFVPFFAPDEPDDDTVKDSGGNWMNFPNNYLDDGTSPSGSQTKRWYKRQGNKDKYDTAPSGGVNSTTSGPNDGCSMATVLRLTTNTASVKTKITQMQATGNTNVPMGMIWGWHVLSPNAPFADGAAYTDPDTKKFAVLLTDGDNTNDDPGNYNESNYSGLGYIWQNRLAAVGSGSSPSQRTTAMDNRLTLLCNNMKSAGVIIYTVRIDMAGTTAPTALANCASSSDKFYDINSSGLNQAFQSIAGSIGRLRIAQ